MRRRLGGWGAYSPGRRLGGGGWLNTYASLRVRQLSESYARATTPRVGVRIWGTRHVPRRGTRPHEKYMGGWGARPPPMYFSVHVGRLPAAGTTLQGKLSMSRSTLVSRLILLPSGPEGPAGPGATVPRPLCPRVARTASLPRRPRRPPRASAPAAAAPPAACPRAPPRRSQPPPTVHTLQCRLHTAAGHTPHPAHAYSQT